MDTELGSKVCAAQAALKKYKIFITNALQFDEKMVIALEKNIETHTNESVFIVGQVAMIDGSMAEIMRFLSKLTEALDLLAEAKEDILALQVNEIYKKDLEDIWGKEQHAMEQYQDKVLKFLNRSLPIILACKHNINTGLNKSARSSRESSPSYRYNFGQCVFMKPKDLEPDCCPMDLFVFKKKFND